MLRSELIDVGRPGAGQVRLRQSIIGVNFHDIYVRSGLYQTLRIPGVPGIEAAAVIESVGPGVSNAVVGDRVAYISENYGGYAEMRLIDASAVIAVPDSVPDSVAGASLVRGLTAHLLVEHAFNVQPGHTVLVHAAAGGVGRLLCQWARHRGATVIGTVGSDDKATVARANGCEYVIMYRHESFVDRVNEITNSRGVDVAYDSVGRDTFMGSLAILARFGRLVNFGQSSGPVEPFAVSLLSRRSNSVSRPILFHYIEDLEARNVMAETFFRAVTDGVLRLEAPAEYPLADAWAAHEAMEARLTSGPVALRP